MAMRSASFHGKISYLRRKTDDIITPRCRPVIESREFYKWFSRLKKLLDQQNVTHKAAGEFLHLMKTLMAKLKVRLVTTSRLVCVILMFPRQMTGEHLLVWSHCSFQFAC